MSNFTLYPYSVPTLRTVDVLRLSEQFLLRSFAQPFVYGIVDVDLQKRFFRILPARINRSVYQAEVSRGNTCPATLHEHRHYAKHQQLHALF